MCEELRDKVCVCKRERERESGSGSVRLRVAPGNLWREKYFSADSTTCLIVTKLAWQIQTKVYI